MKPFVQNLKRKKAGVVFFLLCLFLLAVYASAAPADNVQATRTNLSGGTQGYVVSTGGNATLQYADTNRNLVSQFYENGREIDEREIGPGLAPAHWAINENLPNLADPSTHVIRTPDVNLRSPQDLSASSLSSGDVPALLWSYGCSATSAAMYFGYYDRNGYPNLYTGTTNGGVFPLTNAAWGASSEGQGECPLSASHNGIDGRTSRGHVDDYYSAYDSTTDPYYGFWTEHSPKDSLGDFMGTNQYQNWQNTDGSTRFFFYTDGTPLYDYTGSETSHKRDGTHGLKLFAESRGYAVTTNYNQYIYGYNGNTRGFTYTQYKAEIDAGNPVLIQLTGHTMLGVGYTGTNQIIVHDTWDYSDHVMTWGGTYDSMTHYMVTVVHLAPPPAKSVVSFTANTTSGEAPLPVLFTDHSTNSPTAWTWDFGDATGSSPVKNPSHTYTNPGNYTVTLQASNSGGSASLQKINYIRVLKPLPAFISITSPTPWYRNATITYSITGKKFQPGSTTVTFQNRSGVYLNGPDAGVTSVTTTKINGTIHVPPNAPVGAWNISITTVDGGTAWKDSAFMVTPWPAPTITRCSPVSAYLNTTVTFALTGSNFEPGGGKMTVVDFTNTTGVYLNTTLLSVNQTVITGSVHLDSTLPPGTVKPWKINVTTADGGQSKTGFAFTVNARSTPTISSVSPAALFKNTTVKVTVSGANFRTDAGYANVSVVSEYTGETLYLAITSATSTAITGTLAVPAGITGGTYDLLLTTVDVGTATRTGAFTINYFPLPTISAINQTSGYLNSTVPFMITGTSFQPGGGTFVRINSTAGPPVLATLNSVTGTSITGTFAIPYNAGPGLYRLDVLTISGGSASKSNAFTVRQFPAPTFTTITPASGMNGTTVSFTVKGTNFQPGGTGLTFWNRTGNIVLVPAIVSVSSTQLVGTLAIPSHANPSWYINITTVDGGLVSREKAFAVR